MTTGFETYVEGTTDIQLSSSGLYFCLTQKGLVPQPDKWFNPKGSKFDTGYFYCEVDIPYVQRGFSVLVVAPASFPCKVFYSVININATRVRILLTVSDKSIPINYFIYDTVMPPLNVSKMGLELYKEGELVYASETPILRPVLTGVLEAGKILGVVCNKQSWINSYSWEQEGANEYWITDIDSVSSLEFLSKNSARGSSCQTMYTGIGNSGPSGSGEVVRENAIGHHTFVDITGH